MKMMRMKLMLRIKLMLMTMMMTITIFLTKCQSKPFLLACPSTSTPDSNPWANTTQQLHAIGSCVSQPGAEIVRDVDQVCSDLAMLPFDDGYQRVEALEEAEEPRWIVA
jgi:hypothetical protein